MAGFSLELGSERVDRSLNKCANIRWLNLVGTAAYKECVRRLESLLLRSEIYSDRLSLLLIVAKWFCFIPLQRQLPLQSEFHIQ